MVDQRARDIMNTAMGITSMFHNISEQRREGKKFEQEKKEWVRKDQFRIDEGNFITQILQKKNPEESPDYDPSKAQALISAYTKVGQVQLQDTNFRAAKNQEYLTNADVAQAKLLKDVRQVDALREAGDIDGANAIIAESYNANFPNGDALTYDPTTKKFYELEEDADGNLVKGEERSRMDVEKYYRIAKRLMDDEEFKDTHVYQQKKNRAINMAAFGNAEEILDPKTGAVLGLLMKSVNPETGLPDWRYSANNTADTESWPKLRKGGFKGITRTEFERRQTHKAGLAKTRAETEYKKAAKGLDVKPQSVEGKLAYDLRTNIKALEGKRDESMRLAVAMKQAENADALAGKLISLGYTSEDEEYAGVIKAYEAMQPEIPKEKTDKGLPKTETQIDRGISAKEYYLSLRKKGLSKKEAREKTEKKFGKK
jgi:hypothetical protein